MCQFIINCVEGQNDLLLNSLLKSLNHILSGRPMQLKIYQSGAQNWAEHCFDSEFTIGKSDSLLENKDNRHEF